MSACAKLADVDVGQWVVDDDYKYTSKGLQSNSNNNAKQKESESQSVGARERQ